jgi:uncharacterized membrane protein
LISFLPSNTFVPGINACPREPVKKKKNEREAEQVLRLISLDLQNNNRGLDKMFIGLGCQILKEIKLGTVTIRPVTLTCVTK